MSSCPGMKKQHPELAQHSSAFKRALGSALIHKHLRGPCLSQQFPMGWKLPGVSMSPGKKAAAIPELVILLLLD